MKKCVNTMDRTVHPETSRYRGLSFPLDETHNGFCRCLFGPQNKVNFFTIKTLRRPEEK